MDGEINGKLYFLMDDLGVKPTIFFEETPMRSSCSNLATWKFGLVSAAPKALSAHKSTQPQTWMPVIRLMAHGASAA